FLGNSLNVLITIALFPGIVGYFMFSLFYGNWLNFPMFMLAITALGGTLVFFVALTLMFGTFSKSAGAVAAIPMVVNFAQQFLINIPYAGFIIPQSIYFRSDATSIMTSIALGLPMFSVIPIISLIGLIAICLLYALFKFEKAEF
ncbi:unnamed protein product, partial [marine sediment metagenome]